MKMKRKRMTRRKQKGGDYNNKLQFLLVAWLLPTGQTDVRPVQRVRQRQRHSILILTLLLPTFIQGLFTSFFLLSLFLTGYNSFRLWMNGCWMIVLDDATTADWKLQLEHSFFQNKISIVLINMCLGCRFWVQLYSMFSQ